MERMSLGSGWEHVPLVHTCREEKRSFVTKIIIFISQNPLIISLYTIFLRNFMRCVPFIFVDDHKSFVVTTQDYCSLSLSLHMKP